MRDCLDVVGIGFGPANIAIAAALEESHSDLNVRFLERNAGPTWQAGMLLDGSDIQNHPLRDLVTPRNPRSRYSFTNFLFEQGRFFEYLNLGIEYPLRKEYAQYVSWVAKHFEDVVDYNTDVRSIEVIEDRDEPLPLYDVWCRDGASYRARAIIVAPGRTPLIPFQFEEHLGTRVVHLTNYLPALAALERHQCRPSRICVIGGSQSAVELVLDLAARYPNAEITGVLRGYGYPLKDTSPFNNRVYLPEHVDYYFNASKERKDSIDSQLHRTNYSSVDYDVLKKLYLMIYEQKLDGIYRVDIMNDSEVEAVATVEGGVALKLRNLHDSSRQMISADFVVLATGFRNLGPGPAEELVPPLLSGIADRLARDPRGVLKVGRDYRLFEHKPSDQIAPIYLNGLCERTHGMGDAGSFSLLSLRAAQILASLAERLEERLQRVQRAS